jgi:hypothetical protein
MVHNDRRVRVHHSQAEDEESTRLTHCFLQSRYALMQHQLSHPTLNSFPKQVSHDKNRRGGKNMPLLVGTGKYQVWRRHSLEVISAHISIPSIPMQAL